MKHLFTNVVFYSVTAIGAILVLIVLMIAAIAWLINMPIRKFLGYDYRDYSYFLNAFADDPTHPKKGFRYGTWNPFRKSDWY